MQGWKKPVFFYRKTQPNCFFLMKPGFYCFFFEKSPGLLGFSKRKISKKFIWSFKDNIHVIMCPYDDTSFHFIICPDSRRTYIVCLENSYMSGVPMDIYCYSLESSFFFSIELKLLSARLGPLGLRNCNNFFVCLSLCVSVCLSDVRLQNLSSA